MKVRISKKFTIFIPKAIAEAIGLKEGSIVKLRVEGSKIILEPVLDPFEYALKSRKYAKMTFKEFEKESEEMQDEIYG